MRSSTTIAALDVEPGVARERRSAGGCRSRRRRGRPSSSSPSAKRRPRRAVGAGDLARCCARAAPRRRAPRSPARSSAAAPRVELALHQAVHEVHDRDRAAERGEPARGLEAEQAAADDRGAPCAARRGGDRRAVLGAAEDVDAVQVDARDRRHERVASRCRARRGRSAAPCRRRASQRPRRVERATRVPSAHVDAAVLVPARPGAAAASSASRSPASSVPRARRGRRAGAARAQTSVSGTCGVALADAPRRPPGRRCRRR